MTLPPYLDEIEHQGTPWQLTVMVVMAAMLLVELIAIALLEAV